MDARPVERDDAASCPQCDAALSSQDQRCQVCGYTLAAVRLYNPKHFIWLAVLFSAMVPIYLAATNWGRLGEVRKKWLWLGVGFLGLTLLFTVSMLLPDEYAGAKWLGYLFNLPIAYALRQTQRPVYATALRLGALPRSLWLGSIVGLVLVVAALAVAIAGQGAAYDIQYRRAHALVGDGKFEEAARIFQDMLRRNPDDGGAEFNLALCYHGLERWDEAADGLERCIRRNPADAEAHTFLAYVRARQGRRTEADSLASRARGLDPQVVQRLFGFDEEAAGDWERVMGDRP